MVRENIKEYTVTEISASIKETLEDNFGYVKVRGEVSGLSKPASGHVYLNLKDENAIIKAIAWRSTVAKLSFMPDEGLEVICSGRLTTGYSDRYPGRSDYSIIIDSIVPAGEGALMALLEQRKKKFLNIGKEKTFTVFSKGTSWIRKDNFFISIKEILFRFKKELVVAALLMLVAFLFLF